MQAYFTASVVGKQQHLSDYLKIIDIVKSKGVTIQYEHIINATNSSIRMESKNQRIAFIKQLENWITTADCMIVEATFPSISVGYEISLALHRGKPVLILYSEGDPPSLISDNHEDKVVCEKYTPETLTDIIDNFLNFVRGASDVRFTFFITPVISAYLEKTSRNNKMPKSVYLRTLIEKDMAKK